MSRRSAFSLVELLVVIGIIGILIALLLPAVQSSRGAAQKVSCENRMKQVTLAMLSYESANGHFPPGLLPRKDGTPLRKVYEFQGFGWGAFILPQVEEVEVHDFLQTVSVNFTEPRWWDPDDWDVDAAEKVIPIFMCPSDTMGSRNKKRNFFGNHGKSNYVGVIGPKLTKELKAINDLDDLGGGLTGPVRTHEERLTLNWPGILYPNSATEVREVTDGTSKTFLLGERDGERRASTWCGTDRYSFLTNQLGCTSSDPTFTLNANAAEDFIAYAAFGSQHPGGAYFARADGSITFVSEDIDGTTYERLGAKADGGVVGDY